MDSGYKWIEREEWEKLHNINCQYPFKCTNISVTQLIQYMGYGYNPPKDLGFDKGPSSSFKDQILEWGRVNEKHGRKLWIQNQLDTGNEEVLCHYETDENAAKFCFVQKFTLETEEGIESDCSLYGTADILVSDPINCSYYPFDVVEIKAPYATKLNGACGSWNLQHPEVVKGIKTRYVDNIKSLEWFKKNFRHYLQLQLYLYLEASANYQIRVNEYEDKENFAFPRGHLFYYFRDEVNKLEAAVDIECVYDPELLNALHAFEALEHFFQHYSGVVLDQAHAKSIRSGYFGVSTRKLHSVFRKKKEDVEGIGMDAIFKGITRVQWLEPQAIDTKEKSLYISDPCQEAQ